MAYGDVGLGCGMRRLEWELLLTWRPNPGLGAVRTVTATLFCLQHRGVSAWDVVGGGDRPGRWCLHSQFVSTLEVVLQYNSCRDLAPCSQVRWGLGARRAAKAEAALSAPWAEGPSAYASGGALGPIGTGMKGDGPEPNVPNMPL